MFNASPLARRRWVSPPHCRGGEPAPGTREYEEEQEEGRERGRSDGNAVTVAVATAPAAAAKVELEAEGVSQTGHRSLAELVAPLLSPQYMHACMHDRHLVLLVLQYLCLGGLLDAGKHGARAKQHYDKRSPPPLPPPLLPPPYFFVYVLQSKRWGHGLFGGGSYRFCLCFCCRWASS